MNLKLFASWHAAVALLAVAALIAWQRLAPPGTLGEERTFVLASGWISLGLFVIVLAYVLRKYAHKLGVSPEFKLAVEPAAIERAEHDLKELRRDIAAGRLTDPKTIRKRARGITVQHRVHRVIRVQVSVADGVPQLMVLPTMPLGRTARWFHAHLFYGLAAAVTVVVHGGGRFDSNAAVVLNGLSAIVFASGLVGIVFWVFGPAWLTRREASAGLSIERAHALEDSLAAKIADARAELRGARLSQVDRVRANPSSKACADFLAAHDGDEARDLMVLIGQHAQVRQRHADLSRAKLMMNAWRLVHIPCAILLVAAVVVHVASIVIY